MVLDAKDKAAVKDKIKKRVQAAIKRQCKLYIIFVAFFIDFPLKTFRIR